MGNNCKIYYIGTRAPQHAVHSGYEGFTRHTGEFIARSIKFRWMSGYWGWKVDNYLSRLFGIKCYSVGAFLTEIISLFHMIKHRNSIYHYIYGDMDILLLPFFKNLFKIKLVATYHEPPSILEWLGANKTARKLDSIIVVSNYQISYFKKSCENRKAIYIPHGIDTRFFKPTDVQNKDKVLITVGTNLRDFDTFRQALDIVWAKDESIKVIAIGTNRATDSNPKFNMINERVILLNNISDNELLESYHKSSLLVLPLRDATANNALLESLACGVPAVVTNVGGIGDYVNQDIAFLVNQKDPENMAEKILELLEDDNKRFQMSKDARNFALQFDFQKIAKLMLKAYQEL